MARCYGTRHGAGPFVTEQAGHEDFMILEKHNGLNAWQGAWRVGWADLLSLRYVTVGIGRKDVMVMILTKKWRNEKIKK